MPTYMRAAVHAPARACLHLNAKRAATAKRPVVCCGLVGCISGCGGLVVVVRGRWFRPPARFSGLPHSCSAPPLQGQVLRLKYYLECGNVVTSKRLAMRVGLRSVPARHGRPWARAVCSQSGTGVMPILQRRLPVDCTLLSGRPTGVVAVLMQSPATAWHCLGLYGC